MKFVKYIFAVLAGAALFSCSIDYATEVCPHNVEIVYWYDEEMTSVRNILDGVAESLDEYIFDEQGGLYRHRRVPLDECEGGFLSRNTLPPGRYSVITWANRSDINSVNEATVGVTHREDMRLKPYSPYDGTGVLQKNGDRLYYTYRTFTVPEVGVAYVRADMVHSHLVLKYRVRWKNKAPENTRDFYSDMHSISSEYQFMPRFFYENNTCYSHGCDLDPYLEHSYTSRHHIKTVDDNREHCHRIDVAMNGDKTIHGEYITYNLCNATPATISLWSSGAGTRAGEPVMIMKEIDLSRWFSEKHIELDSNLRQEFFLDFLIDDNGNVTVSDATIGDWGGYMQF